VVIDICCLQSAFADVILNDLFRLVLWLQLIQKSSLNMKNQKSVNLEFNPQVLTALNIVHSYIASNVIANIETLKPVAKPVSEYYGKGFGYGVAVTFIDSERKLNNEVVLTVTLNEGDFSSAIFYNDNFEDVPCSNLKTLTEKARQGLMDKRVINASIH